MTTTIADLAQFAQVPGNGYRERADALINEYRHERATEMESDCHDRWSRIRFNDGSEVIVRGDSITPDNRNAIAWDRPSTEVLAQIDRVSASLASF